MAPTPTATVLSVTVTSAGTTGPTFQLAAAARLSDGSTQDVTKDAAWDSSNPLLATIAPGGAVAVLASGAVDFRATYRNVSGSMHIVVVARTSVVSVTVAGGAILAASFQLTATARLSDSSSQDVTHVATWDSSDTTRATVSSTGLVKVLGEGEVDIRAAYQGVTGLSHLFVSLPKTYALSGVVSAVAPDGGPIAGAQVRILDSSVSANSVLTSANGAFNFPALVPGRYFVEVSKAGYQTWEAEIAMVDRDRQIVVVFHAT